MLDENKAFPWWNQTITICNKLAGKDSTTKIDTWKKTVLHNCFFKQHTSRDISGTTVSVGNSVIIRIPQNPDFKEYAEWKNDISVGFSISLGDYIFLGELEEDISANNIVSVYNAHKPNSCVIRAVNLNEKFGFLEHYKVEGV